ncbi:MAG TPA: hypothetical protein VEZ44_09670 [bacterium]|nr:hypothetical protein [bacterium]
MQSIRRSAGVPAVLLAVAVMLGAALPALADARDISVGGVFICRITHDAPGYTSYERATQVNQRITEVLSAPKFRQGGNVVVRQAGTAATISVGDVLVFTIMPVDAQDTGMGTVDLAKYWAKLLAKGLGQALPGSGFYF